MTADEASHLKIAAQYIWLIPHLSRLAVQHGYVLAFHGSSTRDLDVVACPWEDTVSTPAVLAAAIMAATGGYIAPHNVHNTPRVKPHGRLAWPIHLCADYYLDLSVMPASGLDSHLSLVQPIAA